MDNVSHALAGVLVAEAGLCLRAKRGLPLSPALPALAWVSSAIAHNLPDLDGFYRFAPGGKLHYLLEHRGYTHTLAWALPLALVAWLATWAWARWRKRELSRSELFFLGALCVLGPLFHVSLDFTNNYGVHPFWPFENRWFYGDAIFIVEPFFWVVSLPSLFFAATARSARLLLRGLLWVALGALWGVPFVPWPHATVMTLAAGLLMFWAGRAQPLPRIFGAIGLCLMGLGLFFFSGARGRTLLTEALAQAAPEATRVDVVMTPLPANPLCWEAIALTRYPDERYGFQRVQVAPWPSLMRAEQCPALYFSRPTVMPLVPFALPANPAFAAKDQGFLSLPRLQHLARENCQVEAFLSFSRLPFVLEQTGWVGDFRYDLQDGEGFAVFPLEAKPTCLKSLPPWTPPREDLLGRGD